MFPLIGVEVTKLLLVALLLVASLPSSSETGLAPSTLIVGSILTSLESLATDWEWDELGVLLGRLRNIEGEKVGFCGLTAVPPLARGERKPVLR